MGLLNRESILRAKDLVSELVAVPEWGGDVRVRGLMGWERDDYESSCFPVDDKGRRRENFANMRARLVVLCVVDDEGRPLFQRSDVGDLATKSAAALDRLYTVASRLSGLSAKDMEDLEKNSEPGPSAGTTSG
jgi:hypothetical protein